MKYHLVTGNGFNRPILNIYGTINILSYIRMIIYILYYVYYVSKDTHEGGHLRDEEKCVRHMAKRSLWLELDWQIEVILAVDLL